MYDWENQTKAFLTQQKGSCKKKKSVESISTLSNNSSHDPL